MFSLGVRTKAVLLIAMALSVFAFCPRAENQVAKAEPPAEAEESSVDLSYLALHLGEFGGQGIKTRGIVKFYASFFMYEDFWLQAQDNSSRRTPVVSRFAALPVPREGSLVEVAGTIEHSNLEGGFFYLNASSLEEVKNVVLIGWDGVQRNHLFELLNSGRLPNLQTLVSDGRIVNVTVSDHRTDTKSGWTQILTGYRWWKTGVYNNVYWFHSIPLGYTIHERVESLFGKNNVATAHITGKRGHMEVQNGTSTTATGVYTHEAIYSNIPSQVDVCDVGDRNATIVGPLALQFLENNYDGHFFAFVHFSDPDSAGHNAVSGGENSALYESAIIRCDNWTGQILNKLDALNISQNTLVYVTADHGFDENRTSHNNAPFISLATNDKRVNRNGDQVDVAPTIYYGLGMWGEAFDPSLDGYPLQVSLPEGVEERRFSVLADATQPPKAKITSPAAGAYILGTVAVKFNASDKYLKTVLLLINNSLRADGPWTWHKDDLVNVSGSYSWDTANLLPGRYTITILAFDEHGATNSPSTSTVTVASTQTLAAKTVGNGTITLDKSGPLHYGDVVKLTAVPSAGWGFTTWSDALAGSINPASVTMDSDKIVIATFTQNQYTLTVRIVGNGTVALDRAGPYYYGDVIHLTAAPNEGWNFSRWTGVLAGTNNPNTITIDSDKAVTAVFSETFAPTPLTVSVTSTNFSLAGGQSVTFTASVSGGDKPYSYQWYLNGTAIAGATCSTCAFIPETGGLYNVKVEIVDAQGTKIQFDVAAEIAVNNAPSEASRVPSGALLITAFVLLAAVLGFLVLLRKRKKC